MKRQSVCVLFGLLVTCSGLFLSCVTTDLYSKTDNQILQNDIVVGKKSSFSKNGNIVSESSMVRKTGTSKGIQVVAEISTDSKQYEDTANVKFYKNGKLLAEKIFQMKDGVIVGSDSPENSSTDEESSQKAVSDDELIAAASEVIAAQPHTDASLEIGSEKLLLKTVGEDVKVESTPNKAYIAYSFLGKPFVIAGCTAWGLIKCAGYAFINFSGGYSTVRGDGFFWKMPDVAKSQAKANAAREANRITSYPKYHIPFTNNHITVNTITTETSNAFSKSGREVKVTSKQELEFDNSISVARSAKADANSTASVIGLVGTIVTVPVSAVTWVGGAVFGIYMMVTQNK